MDIQALLALQEEDGRLRDLQRELRVLLPKRKADAQARLQAARDAVEAATRENLAAQREVERFQRDYTRRHEQMARAERNAAGLSDARSLGAAMQEHSSAAEAAARAEAAVSNANQNLSPTERRLDQARAFEAEEDVAVQEIYEAIAARKALVESEIEKVKARRAELAATVPAAQLRYYERLSLTRWPCAVPFGRADGVCSGCNLGQPPSVVQAMLHADKEPTAGLVTCPACGRILI